MKRYIIAAVLLVSTSANAELFAYTENNAGGKINLTTVQNNTCPKEYAVAFATSREGEVTMGCWQFRNDHVWVRYETGRTRAYDPMTFTILEKFKHLGNKKQM